MKNIQNLAGEVYQIDDVILGEGKRMEMEDSMAERFLLEFAGQVEIADTSGYGDPVERKVNKKPNKKT